MKLHNRYRRAKKFKLDEDGEVMDEFSIGRKKRPVSSGWDYWDYKHGRGLLQFANSQKRFFASRVGKPWDNVYSEFIGRTKQEKEFVGHIMRDRMRWSVEMYAVRREDGELATMGRWGYGKLSSGEMYVDPDTKILCRMPAKKPTVRCAPRGEYCYFSGTYKPDVPKKKVGDITYVRKEKEHKRRIGPDKFVYEKQYIWMKHVPYTYTWTDRVGNAVLGYTNVVRTETRVRVYQASKKAISKNKLNEVVDTN